MHAEFRDSEADESDERKHRKGFFRAGFFLFASLKNQKVNTNRTERIQLTVKPAQKPSAVAITSEAVSQPPLSAMRAGGNSHLRKR